MRDIYYMILAGWATLMVTVIAGYVEHIAESLDRGDDDDHKED